MFRRNVHPAQACHARLPAGDAADHAVALAADLTPIALEERAGAPAAPGWIDVLPVGRFTLDDGRGAFTNDEPERVIANSLARGVDLVIDFDHATVYAPKGTQIPAAGWIRELAVKDGKIRARVEWTERGALAVAKREWRYISPVFIASETTRKVIRIWHASLTNDPAIAMRAITAANQTIEGEVMSEELRKLLAKILGLAETATEAEITAAAAKAKPVAEGEAAIAAATRAALAPIAKALGVAETAGPDDVAAAAAAAHAAAKSPDPAKFVPIAAFNELQARVATIEADTKAKDATAEVDAAIAAGKLIPALRDWGLDYAKRDLAGFKAYVAKAPTILAGGRVVTGAPAGDAGGLTPEEKVVCRNLGLSEDAFLKTKQAEKKEAA